jgi:cyanoexosortase A
MVEHVCEQAIGQPLQVVTAQFAAFVLHYVGFNAVQQQTTITINHGAVDVLFRCTGIPLLILLLQLALLFFVLFPLTRQQRVRVIVLAVLIAFLLSSLRVALMAVVVNDPIAFAYWHGGNGSQLFSTGAIVLFGWTCQRL